MPNKRNFTFVVAVNDRGVLANNFLASPCFHGQHGHEISIQENASSATLIFNSAMERAKNDIVIFAHQDMFFPESWMDDVNRSIDILEQRKENWGVLGCFGVTAENEGYGYLYAPGQGFLGCAFLEPMPVQTLDEIVLILKQSSGLKFNESLDGFHLYGPDICMTAAEKGLQCYAIPAFSIHNAQLNLILPREFYRAYSKFKQIWRHRLPIQTTCIKVSKLDIHMRFRRLREAYLQLISKKNHGVTRVQDPSALLKEIFQPAPDSAKTMGAAKPPLFTVLP
jgi:hypothetical protein